MKKENYVWSVIYKKSDSNNWKHLEEEKGYWYADPMLFTHNSTTYLFTEAFNMKKQIGYLAVSKYENNFFSKPKIIIKRLYHMSYPCVFEYNNDIYMIPESSQNGTLELWKCNGDIYHWVKFGNLKVGVKYVDSTIIVKEEKVYLVCYEEKKIFNTYIYSLKIEELKLELLEKVESRLNIKRPAGNFILDKGTILRPVQYNVSLYGESMHLNRIESFEPFCETMIKEIKVEHYKLGGKNRCTHTLSCNEELMVADYQRMKRLPWYYKMIFIRKIRNLFFRVLFKLKYFGILQDD